jgi:hypothetical protein
MKDTKYTPFADIFEGIRRHARSIHTALKRGWNCDCNTPHTAALRLEKRSKCGWGSNFNVAFDIPRSKTLPRGKDEENFLKPKSGPCPASDDWVNELRSNLRPASPPAVNLPPRPSLPHSVSTSSTLSLSSFKSIFTKGDSDSSMASVSAGGGSSVLIQEIQAKYVPTTLVAAETICCKYLLIILEASLTGGNDSIRQLSEATHLKTKVIAKAAPVMEASEASPMIRYKTYAQNCVIVPETSLIWVILRETKSNLMIFGKQTITSRLLRLRVSSVWKASLWAKTG